MPFQRPPPRFQAGLLSVCHAHQPCHGQVDTGDGLFLETGRQDGHLLLVLVDVEGHGVDAALTLDLLENQLLPDPACENRSPADLLQTLHGMLAQHWVAGGKYVAALVLRVDDQTSALAGSNAGLPQPQLALPGATWQSWPLPPGPPLGFPHPHARYREMVVSWTNGQQLLAFTDGVTEAGWKISRQQFQHGPLQTFLLNVSNGCPGPQLVRDLFQALQQHVPSNWPEDDTTVVCLH